MLRSVASTVKTESETEERNSTVGGLKPVGMEVGLIIVSVFSPSRSTFTCAYCSHTKSTIALM